VATGGSGVLPAGQLHPDLVDLLSKEAAKAASHVLQICIRALDYCPPVDIRFGDYLRALITADYDLVADDRHNYRLAFIQAFRQRGIYPRDVRNMSVESLLWEPPEDNSAFGEVFTAAFLHELVPDWKLGMQSREKMFKQSEDNQEKVHERLKMNTKASAEARIVLDDTAPRTFYRKDSEGPPNFQVHSVRPARRIGPDGQTVTDLVVEIIQSRYGYFDSVDQDQADRFGKEKEADFILRGGCTLLIDPDTSAVRYCLYKRMDSENRMTRMRDYLAGEESTSLHTTYFGDTRRGYYRNHITAKQEMRESPFEMRESPFELFALIHRSSDIEEVK
jgi:hypothetical protein